MPSIVIVQSRPGMPSTDTTAPVISNIIGTAASGVTWDTNEPATSQVEYGAGTGGDYYATIMDTPNLRSYWRLGEAAGVTAVNECDAALNMTYVGAPTLGVAGALTTDDDTAVTFDGTTQYVYDNNLAYDVGDTFSLEAWVSRGDLGATRAIIAKATGAYRLALDATGHVMGRKAGGGSFIESNDALAVGWHHIVVTKDGATSALYIDGVEVAHNHPGAQTCIDNTKNLIIGADQDSGYFFNGSIDEVALYSRALTAAEALAHFDAASATSGYGSSTTLDPTLVGHHVVSIPTLIAADHFRVKSADASGNLAVSADQEVGGSTLGRPWALPVTSGTVNVSGAIDDTGATDVTALLQADLDACPDGRIWLFPAGKTYKISSRINIAGRSNLIIDGNGSTLNHVQNANAGGLGGSYYGSFFYNSYTEETANHITIRNFIALAANPQPGVLQVGEHAAFLHVMGGSYHELDNITATGLFGDLFTTNDNPNYAWIHNCHVVNCGRNNASFMSGNNILIEENQFDACGYCGIDLEPTSGTPTTHGNTYITIRNNTFGTWHAEFLAVNSGNRDTPTTDLTISGNTVTGSSLLTLSTYAIVNRVQRFTFTNNTSLKAAAGPVLRFAHIDTLTVTGNVQPLTSGSLYSISDCTGVTT